MAVAQLSTENNSHLKFVHDSIAATNIEQIFIQYFLVIFRSKQIPNYLELILRDVNFNPRS